MANYKRGDEPVAESKADQYDDRDVSLNARDDPKWHQARNQRRRTRYEEDPEYREEQLRRSREAYRQKGNSASEPYDPRQHLANLDDFGAVREVTFPDGTKMNRWCMNRAEVATIFGRTTKLFYRWVSDGRFPETVLTAIDYTATRDYKHKTNVKVPQKVKVYLAEEVRAAINALGDHLSSVAYYRKDHSEAMDAVAQAVAQAREDAGVAAHMKGDDAE